MNNYQPVSERRSEDPLPDSSIWAKLGDVLAVDALKTLNKDACLLIACKSLRMLSFGFLAVVMVIYLSELGFKPQEIGSMFTLTLLGDAAISILITTHADRFGRKLSLLVGSVLAVITGFTFVYQTNYWILLTAAVIGVISPSGAEVGPFMAIEISSISQVIPDVYRTKLMAWYNLFGCFASAFGALICGVIVDVLIQSHNYSLLEACRFIMILYSVLQIFQVVLFCFVSLEIEVVLVSNNNHGRSNNISSSNNSSSSFLGLHKSKWIVLQLSILFMIDSFAGSFVLQSLITGWFYNHYHTSSKVLGLMIFICNLVAGVSALFAAKLADIIGLIMTMVVTHLPSNVLLILVPLMPTETLAIVMLCARYCISQMDVPTRNAYVQGVVDKDERSAANGVTNVIRSIGASSGPYFAGLLYGNPVLSNYPFYIAGLLKIVYDLALLYSFNSIKTDFEQVQALEPKNKPDSTSQKQSRFKLASMENELTPLNNNIKKK